MGLSPTIVHRTQELNGQIKQADANIGENRMRLERAEKQVELEQRALTKSLECAAALRDERDKLADEARAQILRLGETDEPLIMSGEIDTGPIAAGSVHRIEPTATDLSAFPRAPDAPRPDKYT